MKLAKMKVAEMRKQLDARGLDSAGTRPTLMKRLREALNREQSVKASQPRPDQPRKTEETTEVGNTDAPRERKDNQNPEMSEPRAMTGREVVDVRESENLPAITEQTTSPPKILLPANETSEIGEGGKSLASGSIHQLNVLSLDERMQKRSERFGTSTDASIKTDDAIARRRKRFGIVQKDTEEKPSKRRRGNNEVDKQTLKEHEEAKKRRAIKFGISLNAGKELGVENPVSADEMEKRLKRQRRFQQVGS